MFYRFLFSFRDHFTLLNLLRYITFRSIMSFFTAMVIGLVLAPVFIRFFKKWGTSQSERELGPKSHLSKSGTPTMGGIFIIFSTLLSILLWGRLNYYVVVVTLAFVGFGLIGFVDDLLKVKFKNTKGVSGKRKLFLQSILAVFLIVLLWLNPERPNTFFAFYLPFYSQPVFYWSFLLGFLFFAFAIVSFSNATNLSDGLDGLAAGMGIMLYLPFGVFAYVMGNVIASQYLLFPFLPGTGELVVVIAAIIGGYTAFLWYNVHPADIFMGDTGSLAMGGAIATIAVILKQEVLLVVAGAMFVFETLSVVLQVFWFKRTGKRIFKMSPIHHHFELVGWKETQVVIRFWILSALFSLLSLAALKIR